MRALLDSWSLPWQLWVMFGLFIGGILFNKAFRNEFDAFVAHMLGMKKKKKKRRE